MTGPGADPFSIIYTTRRAERFNTGCAEVKSTEGAENQVAA